MEKTIVIDLGTKGTASHIETILNKNIASLESKSEVKIILDFGNVSFIQLDALMFLISFILKQKEKNNPVLCKYPLNTEIASFLNSVRFFEVIKELGEFNHIRNFVYDLPEDFENSYLSLDIFSRKRYHTENNKTVELSDDQIIENLKNIGFYPFVSLPFTNKIEKIGTLKDEPKKWTEGTPLVSIIQKNLPSKVKIGDKISKHIIYESITNSLRHSGSEKSNRLVVSCCKPKNSNFYTLVIWDNGESIIDTLKNELINGKKIRTSENFPDDPHSCYLIRKEKKPGRNTIDNWDFYFSFETPELTTTEHTYKNKDWYILLASFFPGITRDPNGKDIEQDFYENNSEIKVGGRGLTYLINTAVRTFGGEVRIRTSNYFVNIKQPEKDYKTLPQQFFDKFKDEFYVLDLKEKYKEHEISAKGKKLISTLYKAKFETYPKEIAHFYGNMITVHIPQK